MGNNMALAKEYNAKSKIMLDNTDKSQALKLWTANSINAKLKILHAWYTLKSDDTDVDKHITN